MANVNYWKPSASAPEPDNRIEADAGDPGTTHGSSDSKTAANARLGKIFRIGKLNLERG